MSTVVCLYLCIIISLKLVRFGGPQKGVAQECLMVLKTKSSPKTTVKIQLKSFKIIVFEIFYIFAILKTTCLHLMIVFG